MFCCDLVFSYGFALWLGFLFRPYAPCMCVYYAHIIIREDSCVLTLNIYQDAMVAIAATRLDCVFLHNNVNVNMSWWLLPPLLNFYAPCICVYYTHEYSHM